MCDQDHFDQDGQEFEAALRREWGTSEGGVHRLHAPIVGRARRAIIEPGEQTLLSIAELREATKAVGGRHWRKDIRTAGRRADAQVIAQTSNGCLIVHCRVPRQHYDRIGCGHVQI